MRSIRVSGFPRNVLILANINIHTQSKWSHIIVRNTKHLNITVDYLGGDMGLYTTAGPLRHKVDNSFVVLQLPNH